jgi:hypothetical protein
MGEQVNLPAQIVAKTKLCGKALEQWEMSGCEGAGKFTCYKIVADIVLCGLNICYYSV